jgi:hypothetical protein
MSQLFKDCLGLGSVSPYERMTIKKLTVTAAGNITQISSQHRLAPKQSGDL